MQALGDAGYSRIGPSPAWPQGHHLSCQLCRAVGGLAWRDRPAVALHICGWAPLVAFILV